MKEMIDSCWKSKGSFMREVAFWTKVDERVFEFERWFEQGSRCMKATVNIYISLGWLEYKCMGVTFGLSVETADWISF